jgi:hypothetical protein
MDEMRFEDVRYFWMHGTSAVKNGLKATVEEWGWENTDFGWVPYRDDEGRPRLKVVLRHKAETDKEGKPLRREFNDVYPCPPFCCKSVPEPGA